VETANNTRPRLVSCFTLGCVQEILRPFLLVLEFRNPRLVGHALAAIQRMLANNAVSVEGRRAIIQALQQVCWGVLGARSTARQVSVGVQGCVGACNPVKQMWRHPCSRCVWVCGCLRP
jgi:hypothetical protein